MAKGAAVTSSHSSTRRASAPSVTSARRGILHCTAEHSKAYATGRCDSFGGTGRSSHGLPRLYREQVPAVHSSCGRRAPLHYRWAARAVITAAPPRRHGDLSQYTAHSIASIPSQKGT